MNSWMRIYKYFNSTGHKGTQKDSKGHFYYVLTIKSIG